MKSFALFTAILFTILAAPGALGYPPYHDISDTPAAQDEARQRNLPLAYLGAFPEDLTFESPTPDCEAGMTQMALATLQDHAVVIFFDGHNMNPVPMNIHMQYHVHDDGNFSDGSAWIPPKVVFCNADITKILGRVSETQMKADGDAPILAALQVIQNDPTALVPMPPPPPPPLPKGVLSDDSDTPDSSSAPPTAANYFAKLTGLTNQSLYQIGGGFLAVALVFLIFSRSRR